MSTVQTKQTNLREKLAELLDFRKMRDRLSGLGLYIGKDRTGTDENLLVRGGANVDDLQIGEIAALVGGNAVDVFVYDASRDSDGGKWRERTQHTSWYNEELNTATRGGRREFPAVAVIVAEAGKVTIYDGDDPDLSMWMVFEGTYLGIDIVNILTSDDTRPLSSVFALQGILCIGVSALNGFEYINFVDDSAGYYRASISGVYNGGILERNDGKGKTVNSGSFLVDNTVNDVAMTILPNAPIDDDTGLPVPTIAVATNGGVSVIKDDGSVVDLNISNRAYSSVYLSGNVVWAVENPETDYDLLRYFEIPTSDINTAPDYGPNSSPALFPENTRGNIFDSFNYGSPIGITKLYHEGSMVAYTTSKYNTGWMPGDIKLATLSDTTVETIGVNSDELIENGNFDTNTSGWLAGANTTLTVESGRLVVRSTTNEGVAKQEFTLHEGVRYEISGYGGFNASSQAFSTGIYIISPDNTSTTVVATTRTGDGDKTGKIIYTPTTTGTHSIRLQSNVGSGGNYASTFDNISVRATTELVTNGDFSNGTTGWNGLSGGVLSIDNGRLKIEETTNALDAYAVNSSVISTVVGQRYLLTWQFIKGTNTGFSVRVGNSGDQTYNYKSNIVGEYTDDGYYSFEFIATGTELNLSFIVNEANTYGFLDNVSVRPAEEDRSVNNNGLQIVGEIEKTPVAPGADLVAYSGFSDNNYLVQPYNEDLDFGTGDFYISSWFKTQAGTGYDEILAIGLVGDVLYENWVDGGILVQLNLNLKHIQTYLSNPVSPHKEILGIEYNPGMWNQLTIVRRTGYVTLYLNGKQSSDSVEYLHDFKRSNDPKWRLKIGYSGDEHNNFPADNSSLALFKISATAPTAEQIAKIYRDEKALFTDGAQATLYGSSDAVTALAYDEKTELLHVGTASGRSDFSGLRRINNTTTAITTSISAHNNLIAEQ